MVFKLTTFVLITLASLLLLFTSQITVPPLDQLALPAVIGVIGDGIGFVTYLKAIKSGSETSKAVAASYLTPVVSLVFIGLLVGESITWLHVTAAILVVGPLAIVQFMAEKSTILLPDVAEGLPVTTTRRVRAVRHVPIY